MFERLREKQELIEAEQRQYGYQKNMTAFGNTLTPNDDVAIKNYLDSQSDLFRWQEQLKDDVDMLIFQLGYKVQQDGSIIIREGAQVLCNLRCIDQLQTALTPYYFRSMPNTFWAEQRIKRMMKRNLTMMCINLACHQEDYEIKTVSDLALIRKSVENVVYPIMCRSVGGWNKRLNTQVRKVIETPDSPQNQEKKGFFNVFGR